MAAKWIAALILGGTAMSAHADFLGVYAGAGYWNANFGGTVISGVSVEDELKLDTSSSTYVYVAFEHPVPFVPNIKLAHTTLKDSADGQLARSFTYAGQTFTTSQAVSTTIDLTHTDATLYYEILDLGMDLDLGITGRFFQGEVALNGAKEDINAFLPMLYGRAKIGLPFTGTWVGGDVNYVGYGGNNVADYRVSVGWETENFLFPEFGVEGGYRSFSIDAQADDLDVNVDTKIDGVFVNLTGHF
jgi:outer membrane protein